MSSLGGDYADWYRIALASERAELSRDDRLQLQAKALNEMQASIAERLTTIERYYREVRTLMLLEHVELLYRLLDEAGFDALADQGCRLLQFIVGTANKSLVGKYPLHVALEHKAFVVACRTQASGGTQSPSGGG